MKRLFVCVLAATLSTTAVAATNPLTVPSKLEPKWQAKTREVFKQAIEIPSVHNRGEMPRMAKLLADQFRAAGIPESDIHIMPYEALPGDKTVALLLDDDNDVIHPRHDPAFHGARHRRVLEPARLPVVLGPALQGLRVILPHVHDHGDVERARHCPCRGRERQVDHMDGLEAEAMNEADELK